MSNSYPLAATRLLKLIAQDPQFIKLNTIPMVGFQLLYGLLGSVIFTGSTWAYLNQTIPYALAFALNGYAMIMMFTVLHDAVHGAVSRHRWLNDLAGTVGAFIYFPGMSTALYRYLHLTHHRYTGEVKRDPDTKFTNGSLASCMTHALIKDFYWGYWVMTHWSALSTRQKNSFITGALVYIGWYGAWLVSPYAVEFLLIYLLPQRVGYLILVYFLLTSPIQRALNKIDSRFPPPKL